MVEASLDTSMSLSEAANLSKESYYRARYYDTGLGRFLSEDPIEFYSGGTNFYAYVKNRPTKHIDPTGRSATLVGGEAGCFLGPEGCLGGAAIGALIDLTIAVAGTVGVALLIQNIKDKIDAKPKPCDKNRDDHCEAIYENDLATCAAIPNKQQQAVCAKQAFIRYGECLAHGDPISPLSWWW